MIFLSGAGRICGKAINMDDGKSFLIDGRAVPLLLAVLAAAAVLSAALAAGLGPVSVSPGDTLRILASRLPFAGDLIEHSWRAVDERIVVSLRLPRVLLGMTVGASLAVTGVTIAAAAATLGMLFGVFSFLGAYSLSISAFLGSAATITAVYALSRVNGRINIPQLLLSGVAVAMIMDGVTRIITLSAPNALGLHNAAFWMAGSLAGARWSYLTLPFAVLILCMAALMLNHRALNLLLLGEESAATLGVDVRRTHKLLVLLASLMAGTTIAVSGTIGFVGLMVPHFTRLLVGSDHKKVLPVAALLGGVLVVWTDVAARMVIAPEELPVGILTAVAGGPVFIWMLKRRGGGRAR